MMNYTANSHGLKSNFEITLLDRFVRVRWHVIELGEPYPGGDWLIKDPVLEFHAQGREPLHVELIPSGHPDRTMCGQKCFRRMRELAMPVSPLSYAVNLPAGEYSVRFTGELYDCRRLVNYCDAMNIFAGHFSQTVATFEEHYRVWVERGHGDAAAPCRFPVSMTLGQLKVPTDRAQSPRYYPLNEVEYQNVAWEPAPRQKEPTTIPPSPLQPESYFARQIASGVRSLRENGFCRWGTHCTDTPHTGGAISKGGDRLLGMWGSTFSAQYLATGDGEIGAAAWYCIRHSLDLLKREDAPHHKHCLSFGIATEMMVHFAQAVGRPELLEPVANIWRAWPYDSERHTMATQPAADGSDLTPNDTYNMRMKGALAMWLVGHAVGDKDLMTRGRDCVLNFILPAFQPEGYWYYRPMSPEGKLVDGVMSSNHYDGFVKHMLAKLLLYPEWRKVKTLLTTLKRGMDFTLTHLTVQDDRVLHYELYLDNQYPPRVQLAQHLGHAGMFCAPLAALTLYDDPKYIEPLRKSMQYVYGLREHSLLVDYWDNAWLYSIYGGLLLLSRLAFRFEGSADKLTLNLPKPTDPTS